MALVTVVCFVFILAVLASGLILEIGTHARIAQKQVELEQALFIAEAGMERIVANVSIGSLVPAVISSDFGAGSYHTAIMYDGDTTNSVYGSITINPNDDANNRFYLLDPNGFFISHEDLGPNQENIPIRQVLYICIRPGGTGDQLGLVVNGQWYPIQNPKMYTFSGVNMFAQVYKTKSDKKWKVYITGSHIDINDGSTEISDFNRYRIFSIGRVKNTKRTLMIEGLHRQSWARYALWYNTDPNGCWFKSGETFYGPVHANCPIQFEGDPQFFALFTTSQNALGSNTNNVKFHEGFATGVEEGKVVSVNFTNLKNRATHILDDDASKLRVKINETNVHIATWGTISQTTTNITTNKPSYFGSATIKTNITTTSYYAWKTNQTLNVDQDTTLYANTKECFVEGTLNGRLTIVGHEDIVIDNHLTYTVHPTNNSKSALGLVANKNVRIATNAPNNLNIFAHIMATGNITPNNHTVDGKFVVDQYDKGSGKGNLTVYGGIVQDSRGPVGTFNSSTGKISTGYDKHYTFDLRFTEKPPPNYPAVTDQFQWMSWRDITFHE